MSAGVVWVIKTTPFPDLCSGSTIHTFRTHTLVCWPPLLHSVCIYAVAQLFTVCVQTVAPTKTCSVHNQLRLTLKLLFNLQCNQNVWDVCVWVCSMVCVCPLLPLVTTRPCSPLKCFSLSEVREMLQLWKGYFPECDGDGVTFHPLIILLCKRVLLHVWALHHFLKIGPFIRQ